MPVPALPPAFLDRPIAHRALHDRADGRPENSRAAIRAAIAAGYGIEIDLQLSSDGAAMVFHDYGLQRLTGRAGAVRQHDAATLSRTPLLGGDEGIPTLEEVLDIVQGHVPLLVEIKDQDGALGPEIGPLEAAAAAALAGYEGPVAVMSFNPESVAEMARLAPALPRGLTTCAFDRDSWPTVPADRLATLADLPDADRVGAAFLSHDHRDLASPAVQSAAKGRALLCWTIRSPAEEAAARRYAQNITFEGYAA